MEPLFDAPTDPPALDSPALHPGSEAPLAARLRPRTLDEYMGQHKVLGPGTALRTLIERDELGSVVLWGPPGSGKTSLASVIAHATDAAWEELSATSAGVKDVRRVIEAARARLGVRRTVLFIDELHRFNKSQQDALLPAVENGWLVLVGATTENPYFELTAPLLSRCRLVRLEALDEEAVSEIVRRACVHGFGGRATLEEEARRHLVAAADGDARVALTALETAVEVAGGVPDEAALELTSQDVLGALTSRRWRYDRSGDQHYDQVSAFIKSLRGSDPDAAVYWLVRMLAAGEDPRFLARRMVILASEDIGLADRAALPLAVAAFEALEKVGLPEARFALAQAAIALATAPKSNSVTRALQGADRALAEHGNAAVPTHLRDTHYAAARKLGHGVGYQYAHDYPGGFVPQQHLPDALVGRILYEPTRRGDEAEIARRVAAWRRASAREQGMGGVS
ncbi:MAG: replication-associated recombination protein A [Actinomycetota bacterium]|nr:replication-associated recombination protein A [Actinomycetota bacterium]